MDECEKAGADGYYIGFTGAATASGATVVSALLLGRYWWLTSQNATITRGA